MKREKSNSQRTSNSSPVKLPKFKKQFNNSKYLTSDYTDLSLILYHIFELHII
jgi:hypothetical protein